MQMYGCIDLSARLYLVDAVMKYVDAAAGTFFWAGGFSE